MSCRVPSHTYSNWQCALQLLKRRKTSGMLERGSRCPLSPIGGYDTKNTRYVHLYASAAASTDDGIGIRGERYGLPSAVYPGRYGLFLRIDASVYSLTVKSIKELPGPWRRDSDDVEGPSQAISPFAFGLPDPEICPQNQSNCARTSLLVRISTYLAVGHVYPP